MAEFCYRALVRAGIAFAVCLSGQHALASPGCDTVNAGIPGASFTAVNFAGNIVGTVSGFTTGDVIGFTANSNGGTGTVLLIADGGSGSVVLNQPVTPTPASFSYTVTGVGDDTNLQMFFSPNGFATITSSATCASPSLGGSDASRSIIRGFLLSRINGLLLSGPTGTSLAARSNGSSAGRGSGAGDMGIAGTGAALGHGGGFGSTMALGGGLGNAMALGTSRFDEADPDGIGFRTIQFSNSLSQMRRQAAQAQMQKARMALDAGYDGALPLAYQTASPWEIWVEGRYSAFDDDAGNLDRDGHVGVLYVGSDYRVARNVIVGALGQFDWTKDASDVLASNVEGKGWMIGPYLSARVHENIYFDLRAAWGRSSNNLTLGTTTGDFDTSRWLVKGALDGNWVHGAWRLTPSAELAYGTESQNAFTNSSGTFVASQDVSLGRLQFGPEVGYRFAHTADTFIEPFAAIKGVWDFDNPNVAINGSAVGPGDVWGRLEGGLNVRTSGGVVIRGRVSWAG